MGYGKAHVKLIINFSGRRKQVAREERCGAVRGVVWRGRWKTRERKNYNLKWDTHIYYTITSVKRFPANFPPLPPLSESRKLKKKNYFPPALRPVGGKAPAEKSPATYGFMENCVLLPEGGGGGEGWKRFWRVGIDRKKKAAERKIPEKKKKTPLFIADN